MSDNGISPQGFSELAEQVEETADAADGGGGFDISSLVGGSKKETVLKVGKEAGGRLLDGERSGPSAEQLADDHGLSEPTAHAVRGCLRCVGVSDVPKESPPAIDFLKAVVGLRRGGDE